MTYFYNLVTLIFIYHMPEMTNNKKNVSDECFVIKVEKLIV